MKKYFAPAILLLIVFIVVAAYFQKGYYEKNNKPKLIEEITEIMNGYDVDQPEVILDKLDAHIGGIATSLDVREKLAEEITEVADPGAVRVRAANNNIKAYGDVEIDKVGETLLINGHLASVDDAITAIKSAGEGQSGHGLSVKKEADIFTSPHYIDPEVLANPKFSEWSQSFFGLEGDRGLRVSANDGQLNLYGKMTEKLKNRYRDSAVAAGLNAVSQFDIVEPNPAEITVNRSNGEYEAKGVVGDDYNLGLIEVPDTKRITKDPFTEGPAEVNSNKFSDWTKAYFKPTGDRGFSLRGRDIELRGVGTPFLKTDWLNGAKSMNLNPSGKMQLFPSEYHFPSYKVASKIAPEKLKSLQATLGLYPIYFDSGSSEITEVEMVKVEGLANSLQAAGEDVNYVIGGHADSVGNLKMNLRLSAARANSVIAALKERGIPETLFSKASFGSTKAKSAGSSAKDRRVEVLVK